MLPDASRTPLVGWLQGYDFKAGVIKGDPRNRYGNLPSCADQNG